MTSNWDGWNVADDALSDDDLEVLTPASFTSCEPIELVPTVDGDAESEPDQVPDPARLGVSDSLNCVRIWVDGDRVTRVKVSPNWRQRVGKQSLADCFNAVLFLAHLRVADTEPTTDELDTGDLDLTALPPLTEELQAGLLVAFRDVEERWQAAVEALDSEEPSFSPSSATTATRKGATVHLDGSGRLFRVEFDDAWLGGAEPSDIASAVMKAAEQAYDKHTPREAAPSELHSLMTEQKLLVAAFEAMLTKETS